MTAKETGNILKLRDKIKLSLRGHNYILEHKRLYNPMRVNYFANRVVNNWNSLPECIVEAGSLNIFKYSLYRLWSNQDLLYNYIEVLSKIKITSFNYLRPEGKFRKFMIIP